MQNIQLIKLFIGQNDSIEMAMENLETTGEKNLYVVDDHNKLVGSISDGDIRRSILAGQSLETKVGKIMNQVPKYILVQESNILEKAKALMLKYEIESVPIVTEEQSIVNVIYWLDVFKEDKKQYTLKDNVVFVVAGGMGSRLEPFTKVFPKPLIPVGDIPIVERIMDEFTLYGFNQFVLSVNYKAEMIKLYLGTPEVKEKYKQLDYVDEAQPLGTIGSLSLAKTFLKDSFFITNSDIIVKENYEQILAFHKEEGCILTIVGCMKHSVIPYGVLVVDEARRLIRIHEKPEYSHVINTGVYVAEARLTEYIPLNVKLNINDLIDNLIEAGEKISVYPILEGQWFDIGQWHEFERTRKYFE